MKRRDEIPSAYLLRSIKRAEKNRKEGRVSPIFSDVETMKRYCEDDHAKLMNGECICKDKNCKVEETWNK